MEFFQKNYRVILFPFVSLFLLVGVYSFSRVINPERYFDHSNFDGLAIFGFYLPTLSFFFVAGDLSRIKEKEQKSEKVNVLVAIQKSLFFALWFNILVIFAGFLNREIWSSLLSDSFFLEGIGWFAFLNIISGIFHFSSPRTYSVAFLRLYLLSVFILGNAIILGMTPSIFMTEI